ncbi:MAG: hypothetical protein ACXVCP_10470 [Bdellovibrio sp.]
MKRNVQVLLSAFTTALVLGAQTSVACNNISGTYRCNPADAPGVYTTTEFIHTPKLLSIVDISSDGTKTTTDEFKLDGRKHSGPFGIIYSAKCVANEPLKLSVRNIFVKAIIEYKITTDGLTILRNGELFQTCIK